MSLTAPLLSFTIRCPRSLNHAPRHWAAKARLRRALYVAVLAAKQQDPRWRAAVLHPLLDADRVKRRVVFTRGIGIAANASGKGKHPTNVADMDGLAGGLKPLLDVLLVDKPRRPGHGFLVDDSPAFAVVEYRQDTSVEAGMLKVEVFSVARCAICNLDAKAESLLCSPCDGDRLANASAARIAAGTGLTYSNVEEFSEENYVKMVIKELPDPKDRTR